MYYANTLASTRTRFRLSYVIFFLAVILGSVVKSQFNGIWLRLRVTWQVLTRAEECSTVVIQIPAHGNAIVKLQH
jgi:hypothetical protein